MTFFFINANSINFVIDFLNRERNIDLRRCKWGTFTVRRILIEWQWLNRSGTSIKSQTTNHVNSTLPFFRLHLAKPFQLFFHSHLFNRKNCVLYQTTCAIREWESPHFVFQLVLVCARVCKRTPLSQTAVHFANFFHFIRNKALPNLYCRLKVTEFETKRHCSLWPRSFSRI